MAQLAVEDQSIEVTDMRLAFAPAGEDYAAAGSYTPTLTPGEEFWSWSSGTATSTADGDAWRNRRIEFACAALCGANYT
jgi:hypothetical protein